MKKANYAQWVAVGITVVAIMALVGILAFAARQNKKLDAEARQYKQDLQAKASAEREAGERHRQMMEDWAKPRSQTPEEMELARRQLDEHIETLQKRMAAEDQQRDEDARQRADDEQNLQKRRYERDQAVQYANSHPNDIRAVKAAQRAGELLWFDQHQQDRKRYGLPPINQDAFTIGSARAYVEMVPSDQMSDADYIWARQNASKQTWNTDDMRMGYIVMKEYLRGMK